MTYAVIVVGALLWCAMIFLAPYFAAHSFPISDLFYRFFQPICHQVSERSFHLFGEKLAVCSRCSSIYLAFLAGVVAYPFFLRLSKNRVPSRKLLFAAMAPMLLDVGLEFVGIRDSTFSSRAISGATFGLVISLFILPTAIEAVQQLASHQPSSSVNNLKGIPNARKT